MLFSKDECIWLDHFKKNKWSLIEWSVLPHCSDNKRGNERCDNLQIEVIYLIQFSESQEMQNLFVYWETVEELEQSTLISSCRNRNWRTTCAVNLPLSFKLPIPGIPWDSISVPCRKHPRQRRPSRYSPFRKEATRDLRQRRWVRTLNIREVSCASLLCLNTREKRRWKPEWWANVTSPLNCNAVRKLERMFLYILGYIFQI